MTPFLQKIASDIVLKYGDSLDNICIIVPSQRAHTFLLSYFSKELKKTFIAPKIVTIDEFMSSISGLQTMDNTQLLLELFMLNKELNPATDNDMVKFSGWAQQFLGDINDVDLHLADAQSIFTSIADIKELSLFDTPEHEHSPRQIAWLAFFKQLYFFYTQFNSTLLHRHFGYQGMIYRYVADHIHELISKIQYQKLIFCGFNALTIAEQKVIKTLYEQGLVETYWDADSYYLDDFNRDAGNFLRQNFKSFHLDKPSFISTDYADIAKKINIIAAQNNVAQAKFVGQLLADADANNLDLNKTVIVPADENILIPLLNSIPLDKMNITMGLPISQTSLYSFLLLLFDMQLNVKRTAEIRPRDANKLYIKDIASVLNHPYSVAVFEFYKFSSDEINNDIQRFKRSFFTLEEMLTIIGKKELNTFINSAFTVWNKATDGILAMIDLVTIFTEIVNPISQSNQKQNNPEKLIFSNAANALQCVLQQLHKTVMIYEDVIDIANLRFLFETESRKETLSFKGDAQEGLQLMGVLETRTLDFENIIFLSINEGVLPSGKTISSLIPFDVKRHFKLPSYQYKDAVFAYHFFRLIQRAKQVFVLYNSGSADGKAERSRFVEQLTLELPKYNPLTEIKKQTLSFDSVTVSLPELSYAKTTKTMEAIKAIPHFSPSSLSKYINCKLQFYFSYVLRLKVPDEMLEFADDATLGTVIHATLEEIYTPFIDAEIEIKKLSNLNIADLVTAQFAKPKNKISFTSEDLVHGRNRLAFEIATRYVENVLTADRESKEKHTLRALEKELNYTLTLDENSALLFGKADRIDELEEGSVRIIDYKTGSVDASKLKVKGIEALFYDPKQAKSFQLMMYAYMYYHSISSSELIRSGIVSIRDKKAPFNPLIVNDSDIITSEILAEFEAYLRLLLSEIYDKETSFDQTQDTQRCQYCDYKTICNR